MKFNALLKKELRECLPWLLLTLVVFAGMGWFIMKTALINQQYYNSGYRLDDERVLTGIHETRYLPISGFGPLLLIVAIALGIVLAVRQFLMPDLLKTWALTIHRTVRPTTVLWAKFTAAGLSFILTVGILWMLFYSYAAAPGRFSAPIFIDTFWEGCIYILTGGLAYLGITLTAVSTAHWYTTRLLGAALAFLALIAVVSSTSILSAVLWILAAAAVLGVLIVHTLLTREY